MKAGWKRWGWPIAKAVLAIAILAGVGHRFYVELQRPEIATLRFEWQWAILSGLLYLLALGFPALYWYRLLRIFNQQPKFLPALRAHYVAQLGKYVPGKAVALLMRGALIGGPNVRAGVAILTSFYEVLTTMASGLIVAALIFAIVPPRVEDLEWPPLYTGLLLLSLVGVPLMPGVFNVLMKRLARKFPLIESYQVPRMRAVILIEGLLITSLGWICMGLSVWAILQAVLPEPPPFSFDTWIYVTGVLSIAYVAGFLAVVIPSGVGIREYFLFNLLVPFGGRGLIVASVVLLRLVWTFAEVGFAGLMYAAGARMKKLTIDDALPAGTEMSPGEQAK